MLNQPSAPPSISPATETASVQAAFAALPRGQQRLLEALLFDGESCTRIAQATGASPTDVRERAGAAMLELHAAMAPRDRDRGGAVAAMLVLRALDALDPDEVELVDVVLLHQPGLQRVYEGYLALVGELCALAVAATPAAGLLARLRASVDDDCATN